MADYNLQSKQNQAMGVYNKGPKAKQKGLLTSLLAEAGQDAYTQMSPAARLGLLQAALRDNPEQMSPGDMGVLKLLRNRRQQEAGFYESPQQQPQPGLLARLFGGYNQLNQTLKGQ